MLAPSEAPANLEQHLRSICAAALRPPPTMTVPEWADEFRRLSLSSSSTGGPWQTSRVEIARGPMLAVTEPGVMTITVMSCTQLMKTSILENVIGYFTHLDPCPMLLVQPKDEAVEAFSKERLTPMLSSTPVLQRIMGNKKTRISDDTLRFKRYPGGFLAMASAGSPTNLAMRAIRVSLLDEIDKYETTKEGDPVVLAEERLATFGHSRLSIRACSPTWVETSRIYKSYLEGDQRKPYVACPHCDHEQSLDFFKHVHWNKDDDGEHQPETAAIHCESCGSEWTELERLDAIATLGRVWHYQTKPFVCCGKRQEPEVERNWQRVEAHMVGYAVCKVCGEHGLPHHHASFCASKMFSPFISIVELAQKWILSKDDPESKQTFYNTQLGQPYRAEVQRDVATHYLLDRREQYTAQVPEGAVVLTFGADVQPGGSASQGRIEVEVVAWGQGEESWSIDTPIFEGDPARSEVWKELDEYLKSPFEHESGGVMYIRAGCIDSGGHNTQEVYNFCRQRVGRNIWAIKGASDTGGQWSPIWPAPAQLKRERYRTGYKPIILGVNAGKEAIRQRLLIDEPGPGYCHFRVDQESAWFDQLTSEQLVIEKKHGQSIRKWMIKKGRSNEALDCRVYSYAALWGLYIVRRWTLDRRPDILARPNASPREVVAAREVARSRQKVRRSSFMS